MQQCGAVKLCTDIGALRAFAHHGTVGTLAQGQLQGVDQDGFARPSLSSQCSEARRKLQIELVNNHEIAQRDALERHRQEPPSFQRSFFRKVSK